MTKKIINKMLVEIGFYHSGGYWVYGDEKDFRIKVRNFNRNTVIGVTLDYNEFYGDVSLSDIGIKEELIGLIEVEVERIKLIKSKKSVELADNIIKNKYGGLPTRSFKTF